MNRHNRAPLASLGLLAMLVLAGCQREAPPAAERTPVRIAAASDLTLAFEELGRAFERQSGRPVVFSFGSTGLLAKQLREGAPFDVFAAAHVSFVDDVVAAGVCDGATRSSYARGRLAVFTGRVASASPASLADLADARFTRIAIANPEHAPYGQAARQALQRAGVWSALEPRLVLGENVRQTLQFAETGNVDAAIVALALVIDERDHPWLLLDEAMHRPLDQALVVCTHGSNRKGGDSFARFVHSEQGQAVLRRYGLLPPGENLVRAP